MGVRVPTSAARQRSTPLRRDRGRAEPRRAVVRALVRVLVRADAKPERRRPRASTHVGPALRRAAPGKAHAKAHAKADEAAAHRNGTGAHRRQRAPLYPALGPLLASGELPDEEAAKLRGFLEVIEGLRAGADKNGLLKEGRWGEVEEAWRSAMEMATARISRGKISLTVRYAALAAEEAMKKMTLQHNACVNAVSTPRWKSQAVTARRAPDAT